MPPTRMLLYWALALITFSQLATASLARPREFEEYQVKAAYLLNFAYFITWPAGSFATSQSPLTICVVDPNPFDQRLDNVIAGETIQGRPLRARYLSFADSFNACHILYIPRRARAQQPAILRQIGQRPVFTVGESTQFTTQGGVAAFYRENEAIRFVIDPRTAHENGLLISYKLLKLAKLVGS